MEEGYRRRRSRKRKIKGRRSRRRRLEYKGPGGKVSREGAGYRQCRIEE
jgi:hypothetical protein